MRGVETSKSWVVIYVLHMRWDIGHGQLGKGQRKEIGQWGKGKNEETEER
jgi:hypothetical protein